MEGLLLKLQNEIAARKRARPESTSLARLGGFALIAVLLAFELGARTGGQQGIFGVDGRPRSDRLASLATQLEARQGEIDIQRAHIERLERAYELSSRYGIGADLAMTIEEVALAEGVEPQLAFDLVRIESRFNPRAVSPVGALGLTQLMPETAALLSPGITREEILDRETNLRLGLRFYQYLLRYYDGDVRLALLAYNRGPATVDRLIAAGVDPANGYATAILGTRLMAD